MPPSSAASTIAPPPPVQISPEASSILLPLVYGSLFDFPLTVEELGRLCGRPLGAPRIREILREELASLVFELDGYHGLSGREASVEVRRSRTAEVEVAWRTARRRARLIGLTPFVRGLMVTGSLAHDNFAQDADIDYLVLVAPRRLFTVFAFLGTAQRFTSVQTLCPNYYLAVDRLVLPEKDYFIAREILAATPVLGTEAAQAFQDANAWAFDYFPAATRRGAPEPDTPTSLPTRLLEWTLSGRLGDAVERLMQRLLVSRIQAHYDLCQVPLDPQVVADATSGMRLRFHARLHRERVRARLVEELERLGVAAAADLLDLTDGSRGAPRP